MTTAFFRAVRAQSRYGVLISLLSFSFLLSLCSFQDDSPDLLASDVHTAGAGICNDSAVMKLAEEGPGRVEQMLLRGSSEVGVTHELRQEAKGPQLVPILNHILQSA